jgi:hypothetical protein
MTLNYLEIARLEVFTAVKIQVEVFWVVTPCSVVEAAWTSETSVSYHITTRHGVTTQETSTD